MNLNEIKKYQEIFVGWSNKEINQANQMIRFLEHKGLTPDDLHKFSDHLKTSEFSNSKAVTNYIILQQKHWDKNVKRCPECGSLMNLGDVNTVESNQIKEKNINSVWTCSNLNCLSQMWETKKADEISNEIYEEFEKQYDQMSIEDLAKIDVPNVKIKSQFTDEQCFKMQTAMRDSGYSPIDVVNLKGIIHVCESNSINLDDLFNYVDEIAVKESAKLRRSGNVKPIILPACPECQKTTLRVYPVNSKKCDQVGGGYHSQIFCANCGYDKYSKKPVNQLIKKLIKKGS